jgi:hypothetical protein
MSATASQDLENKSLRPALLPRRGEFVAWGSTLLAAAAWIFLRTRGERMHPAFILLAVFLLLSALALSLGNWVDRHSLLRLTAQGIEFENGLRRLSMPWDQVRQVQVFQTHMGKKVRVLGERAQFDFRTLAEIQSMGKVKGRIGFPEGEAILETILVKADLKLVEQSSTAYYYAHE